MIVYWNLFRYLDSIGRGRSYLLNCISTATLAKLSKNETVNTNTIDKICSYLQIDSSRVLSWIPDDIYYKYFPKNSDF